MEIQEQQLLFVISRQTIRLIGIATITYGSTILVPSITRTGCKPMPDTDRVVAVSTLWLGAKERVTPVKHRVQ